MWTKSFNFEVTLICFLTLIPWPGPSVFKISCSRESARVVRKIVQSKWLPILDKYQVKIPLDCPFHPMRDIFGPQQAAKTQNRPSQWTCGFCGKSFYEEQHLDTHFEHRHSTNINMAEDAVCLADYCDIMRCKVLGSKDSTFGGKGTMSTDIEIWREATAYRTALQPTGPRELAKLPPSHIKENEQRLRNGASTTANLCEKRVVDNQQKRKQMKKKRRHRSSGGPMDNVSGMGSSIGEDVDEEDEDDDEDDDEEVDDDELPKGSTTAKSGEPSDEADINATQTPSSQTSTCDNLVDSALPAMDQKEQRILEMQRMKANCKSEDLDRLRTRCEILVRNCVVGLLREMADEEFLKMEEELNRAVCWYLTCDRYWEDGPMEQRPFPWGLVFVLVMVLSLGVCFCYYVIWILFDTEEHRNGFPSVYSHYALHTSPTHHQYLHSNAMVASSIGYAPALHHQQPLHHQLPMHQQQHLVQHHQSQSSHAQLHHPQQQQHSATTVAPGHSQLHPPPPHQPHHSQQLVAGPSSVGGAGNVGQHMAAGSSNQPPLQQPQQFPDEYYVAPEFNDLTGAQSEHYIYVTYPPELKRRLLESCYNRTTRL